MRPPPWRSITRITAWLQMKVPLTLTSIVRRHSATDSSAIGATWRTPALLTRKSIRPKALATSSTAASTASSSVMSTSSAERRRAELVGGLAGAGAVLVEDRDPSPGGDEGGGDLAADPAARRR